jgi:hypothetical protein
VVRQCAPKIPNRILRAKVGLLELAKRFGNVSRDPPPLKWSDLRYVFGIKEDCNGKEAIQA